MKSTNCLWLHCQRNKELGYFANCTQFHHHGEEMPHHTLHGVQELPENLVILPTKVLMDLLEITLPLNLLRMMVPLDLLIVMVPQDPQITMVLLDLLVIMNLLVVTLLDMISPPAVISLHEEVLRSVAHRCSFNLPTQLVSQYQCQIQQIILTNQLQQLMFLPPWSPHLVQVFLFQMVCLL